MDRSALEQGISKRHFRELATRAAFLCREFLTRANCLKRESLVRSKRKAQRGVIYILDTDVLIAYASPRTVGPESPMSSGAGRGEMMPPRFPVSDETLLTQQEVAELRFSRREESRLASLVSRFLASEALKTATQSRKNWASESEKDELESGCHVYMFDGHIDEIADSETYFLQRSRSSQTDADSHNSRTKIILQQIQSAVLEIKKRKEPIIIEDLVDNVFDDLLKRSSFAAVGAAASSAALNSIKRKAFDFTEFHGLYLTQNKDHTNSDIEEEQVARSFLHWYFGRRLRAKDNGWNSSNEDIDNKDIYTSSPTSRTKRSYYNDVDALTDLVIMNRRLLESGSDTRLVFITGDKTLVRSFYFGDQDFHDAFDDLCTKYISRYSFKDGEFRRRKLERFFFDDLLVEDQGDRATPVAPADGVSFATSGSKRAIFGQRRHSWFDSFGLHHVQHMHGFAHDHIAEDGNGTLISNIFSPLFADISANTLSDGSVLEEVVLKKTLTAELKDYKERFQSTVTSWRELTWKALRTRQVSHFDKENRETYNQIIGKLRSSLGKKAAGQEDASADDAEIVAGVIDDYLYRTQDLTQLNLSNIGTELLIGQPNAKVGRWIVRNPPDMVFSVLPASKMMFEKISLKFGGYSDKSLREFQRDYDSLVDDTQYIEDGRGRQRLEIYLKMLVLGAAFAAAEKWELALRHAQKAIHVLERANILGESVPEFTREINGELQTANLSGREAYFLAAIAQRTLSRGEVNDDMSSEDVDKALAFLNKCSECLESDDSLGDNQNTSYLKLRNAAEEIAVEQTRYYLVRSSCWKNDKEVPGCGDSDSVYCDRCRRAYFLLEDRMNEIFVPERVGFFDSDRESPYLADMALSFFIIQMHAIRTRAHVAQNVEVHPASSSASWRSKETLSQAVDCLKRVFDKKKYIVGHWIETYRLVGNVMLGRIQEVEEFSSFVSVNEHFDELSLHCVTTFDVWRCAALRDYVLWAVNEERQVINGQRQ